MKKPKNHVKSIPTTKAKDKKKEDKMLDKELKDTFPASDSTAKY